jgi:hypothetical protein
MNQSIPTTIPSSSHAHNPFAQSSSQGHVSTSFPRPASFQRSWSGRGIGSSTGMDIGSGKPESGLSQMMKQSDQGSPASSGVPASSPIGIGGKHRSVITRKHDSKLTQAVSEATCLLRHSLPNYRRTLHRWECLLPSLHSHSGWECQSHHRRGASGQRQVALAVIASVEVWEWLEALVGVRELEN